MDEGPPCGQDVVKEGVQSFYVTPVTFPPDQSMASQCFTIKEGEDMCRPDSSVPDLDGVQNTSPFTASSENATSSSPSLVCSVARHQLTTSEPDPHFELDFKSEEREESQECVEEADLVSHGVLAAATDNTTLLQLSAGQVNGTCSSTYRYLKLLCPGENGDLEEAMSDLYKCRWSDCSKSFRHLEHLVTHVNDQHVKVERDVEYRCQWASCPRKGKGFNARYKMLIHVRTHTNEKPHECMLCGKSFSRLENLKIHNRSHTGEKPYICPFEGCKKAYSNSSDRFKHVRTHQTDKPYWCKTPGCNKRYTDPSSLRKHIKTHGHFFKNRERDIQPHPDQHMVHTSPVALPLTSKDMTKPITSNAVLTLTPSGFLNHSMPTQVISIQGNMLQISTLASNPLLSSTVTTSVINTQSTSTQTDVSSDVSLSHGDSPVHDLHDVNLLEDRKEQESPLDLSTSPILAGHTEDSSDTNGTHYTAMWKFVSAD